MNAAKNPVSTVARVVLITGNQPIEAFDVVIIGARVVTIPPFRWPGV
jgi:hypothetical protein